MNKTLPILMLALLLIVHPASLQAQDAGISGILTDDDFQVDDDYDQYDEYSGS